MLSQFTRPVPWSDCIAAIISAYECGWPGICAEISATMSACAVNAAAVRMIVRIAIRFMITLIMRCWRYHLNTSHTYGTRTSALIAAATSSCLPGQ